MFAGEFEADMISGPGLALKVGHGDGAGQQAERVEGVGNALLACDHVAVDREDSVRLTLQRDREHGSRQANGRAQLLRDRLDVVPGPVSFSASSTTSTALP